MDKRLPRGEAIAVCMGTAFYRAMSGKHESLKIESFGTEPAQATETLSIDPLLHWADGHFL